MRLICPNCEAQYEVSDDAIPPGGRDVQCSNCNQSWFQTEKPTTFGRPASQPAPKPAPPPAEPAPAEETEPEAAPETAEASAPPPRRPLDNAVASILREEAALTAATAASQIAKPPATEASKPTAEPVAPDETRQRIALMTRQESDTETNTDQPATDSADAHLRAMPSINEINATLRARAQANDTSGLTEKEKHEAVQRSGFRRGFFLVLVLFAILIAPYFFAEQITENLPQTRSFMATYVTTIDQIRVTLSDFVNSFISD